MAEPVKAKRRYDSPRRREAAAATRREILEAAERLFERQGYAATTMATIAAEARVALKTVYVAFETKSGVLRALWNLRLRGEHDELPVAQQQWYREVLDEPDPERQLRLDRPQLARGQAADRTRARDDPRRRADRPGHRRALEPDRNRVPRQPARDRAEPRRQARARARARRRARRRHPLDDQPPQPLATARRRARLEARSNTSSGAPTSSARNCSTAAGSARRARSGDRPAAAARRARRRS